MKAFTYKYYEKLINVLKRNNYEFVFFNEVNKIKAKRKKIILLRHDVDFDVNKAKVISKIEKKNNIKSTYFFLLNSKFYNIHNSETYRIIKQISEDGNKIGIHFDEASYNFPTDLDLNGFVKKEISFFEKLFCIKVEIISFHRPTKNVLLNKINTPIPHTYQDVYAKTVKYISDSKKYLKEGDLIDIVKSNKYDKLHFLLHPFWWGNKHKEAQQDYEELISLKISDLKRELSRNSEIFRNE